MSFDSLILSFLSQQQAFLPTALSQYGGLYLAWALVLAWGVSALTQRWPPRYRWCLMAVVVSLTLVPGPSSPAYWLGLAFQSPSVTSLLLAAVSLWSMASARPSLKAPVWGKCGLVACALVAALGWVLLLDTFARWSVSVYAWGFSPVAVATLAVTLTICWAIFGAAGRGRMRHFVFGVPAMALVIFVVTRWPSGNVWDAVLDPWLWVGLHWVLLINVLRRWRLRGLPAIQV